MLGREREFILSDRLAGVDEAGRGALAGPVVLAVVILPKTLEDFGSGVKYLSERILRSFLQKKRQFMYK